MGRESDLVPRGVVLFLRCRGGDSFWGGGGELEEECKMLPKKGFDLS